MSRKVICYGKHKYKILVWEKFMGSISLKTIKQPKRHMKYKIKTTQNVNKGILTYLTMITSSSLSLLISRTTCKDKLVYYDANFMTCL